MAKLYPSFLLRWESGQATWTGTITPLNGCESYVVRIRYRLQKAPRVLILSPTLADRRDGERIPHRFSDGSLCLHFPDYEEWTPHDFIADTLPLWASLWLYHYEVWLATGHWHGGGIHPKPSGTHGDEGRAGRRD